MTFKCHWVLNVLGILKKKATKAELYCSRSYGGIGLCVKLFFSLLKKISSNLTGKVIDLRR